MHYGPITPHSIHSHATEIAAWGIPASIAAIGVIAQAANSVPFDWLNLTALAALILIAVFLVTKFLPAIQKATEASQVENNKVLMETQENHTKTIAKIQEEHSTTLRGITMDFKELMSSTVEKLVAENKQQRESLLAHFDSQVQRYISVMQSGGFTPGPIANRKQETKP